jgi:hypothetical protein
VAAVSCGKNRRAFVQPSGADRASLVDVPSTYQDESHFTPRPGNIYPFVTHTFAYIPARHAWLQARSTSARRFHEY